MESKGTSRNYGIEKKNIELPTQFEKWPPNLECNVLRPNPTTYETTSPPLDYIESTLSIEVKCPHNDVRIN
jgi:hypothetical protein